MAHICVIIDVTHICAAIFLEVSVMYEVVGFSRSEFQAKDNNQVIRGYQIYVQYEDQHTTGYRCERLYLNDGKCDYIPHLGDRINVMYNKYGKVEAIYSV